MRGPSADVADAGVLDALDDVVLVFDETGTVLAWNRAAEEVTGHTDADLGEATVPGLFTDADADRLLAAVDEVLETGTATVDADLVTADGERIPYELQVRRLDGHGSFAGIGRDVTERVRQQTAIDSRERVMREMYEVIADRERSFTDRVEALLELGRAELDAAYGTLSHIQNEDYVFEVVDADDDSIQAGDVVPVSATNCEIAASTEQTLVLANVPRDAPEETDRAGYADWGISCYIGAPVFAEDDVYGTFCFYDTDPRDGQFSDWEVTLVDLMSRWVSYELQREQANDRLKRQNAQLERFASIVSHDLRNPLNVASGALDMVEETGDPAHVEDARNALERMDTLIEDLLTLSRSGATIDDPESVRLDALVTACWRNVVTADATLVLETERTVTADRTRLQQLLENLVRNAVEHGSTSPRSQTPEDADEHGSTSPRSQTPEDADEHGGDGVTITVGDTADGFFVEDDGPGIPEDERERAFESGYTTSPDGTGFGLAIVEEIATAHGWTVDVTAGTEGGARFEFSGVTGSAE